MPNGRSGRRSVSERFRLARAAETDLIDLWHFGAARWSSEPADSYEDGLLALFDLLSKQPSMAHERPDLGAGVRVHPYRSHVVFYHADDDGIEVLRIAHSRSDWTDVLGD